MFFNKSMLNKHAQQINKNEAKKEKYSVKKLTGAY